MDHSKLEYCDHSKGRHVCWEMKMVFQEETLKTVKHHGENVMLWGCFAVSGPMQFVVESTKHSASRKVCLMRMLDHLSES